MEDLSSEERRSVVDESSSIVLSLLKRECVGAQCQKLSERVRRLAERALPKRAGMQQTRKAHMAVPSIEKVEQVQPTGGVGKTHSPSSRWSSETGELEAANAEQIQAKHEMALLVAEQTAESAKKKKNCQSRKFGLSGSGARYVRDLWENIRATERHPLRPLSCQREGKKGNRSRNSSPATSRRKRNGRPAVCCGTVRSRMET